MNFIYLIFINKILIKKMKISISLYIFILSFSKIYSNTIFPSPPSEQVKKCIEHQYPSASNCTSVPTSDSQYSCCYVTGAGLKKCGYLENTEYGISKYENIYSDYDDVSIECKADYVKNIFFISFLFLILFI